MTRNVRIKPPPACPRCASTSLKKNGSYSKKRSRVKVQRFICLDCKQTHSQQTARPTSSQHRPELLEEIMTLLGSGLGVRRIAQALETTPRTVQAKIKNRDYEIAYTLDLCNQMKPQGRIVMETGEKLLYQKFRQHFPDNAKIPKEVRKLFPINQTMACMRAELAICRRESWYGTKNTKWFNAHLAISTSL